MPVAAQLRHQAMFAAAQPDIAAMGPRVPMGRLGTGDDIAAAVGFLCSEEAGFITGQTLGVNGGSVM